MSNRLQRADHAPFPTTGTSDREAIRLLRNERAVIHFECSEFDAYVKAPEGIVREFIVLYTSTTDRDPEYNQEWHRTRIDPLTLKRELRRREFRIVAVANTPFSDR